MSEKRKFIYCITLMCLNIGTPKILTFPFVPNGKLITGILGVPILKHITVILINAPSTSIFLKIMLYIY